MPHDVETLRTAIEAFNRRDYAGLEAVLAPDAVIVPARAELDGIVYRGREAVPEYCAGVDAIWEDLTCEIDDIWEGGDWVLALGRMRGRARCSGAVLDVTAGWVFHFRDRLITRFHAHTDRARALEAVGMR
jgi:ketosteroid isomerase-like protein